MTLLFGCGGGGSSTQNPHVAVAPVANAGTAQSVVINTLVTLDGSGSTASSGAVLTYGWSFSSKPGGSNAALSSATVVKPTFTPDIPGVYVLKLVVNDGSLDSAASTVTITAFVGNAPPVANAGRAQSVVVNTLVTLDGSGSSDANGDTLTYSWSFSSKPAGSSATLSSATVVKPTFTPDVAGDYVLSLVVNDGTVSSAASSVTITSSASTAAPVTTASPPGGTYATARSVTLTASEPATIYYTTNGVDPTTSSSNGTSPVQNIQISGHTFLKFFAIVVGKIPEAIKTEEYVIP